MIEVLDKPATPKIVRPERWHDQNIGLVYRYIGRIDNNGEDMAYAEKPIQAETGFKASVLGWDRIRSLVTKFSWLTYSNYTVRPKEKLTSWEEPRHPKPSPNGIPDAIQLTAEGDLIRDV